MAIENHLSTASFPWREYGVRQALRCGESTGPTLIIRVRFATSRINRARTHQVTRFSRASIIPVFHTAAPKNTNPPAVPDLQWKASQSPEQGITQHLRRFRAYKPALQGRFPPTVLLSFLITLFPHSDSYLSSFTLLDAPPGPFLGSRAFQ